MLAVENLIDQVFLADAVKNAKNSKVRKAALEKLDSEYQELFYEIARDDSDRNVIYCALERLIRLYYYYE